MEEGEKERNHPSEDCIQSENTKQKGLASRSSNAFRRLLNREYSIFMGIRISPSFLIQRRGEGAVRAKSNAAVKFLSQITN